MCKRILTKQNKNENHMCMYKRNRLGKLGTQTQVEVLLSFRQLIVDFNWTVSLHNNANVIVQKLNTKTHHTPVAWHDLTLL